MGRLLTVVRLIEVLDEVSKNYCRAKTKQLCQFCPILKRRTFYIQQEKIQTLDVTAVFGIAISRVPNKR